MRWYAGTSGYAYDGWAGSFYPEKLPARKRLAYYANRLPAVEINSTFYRLPRATVLESWAEQVPDEFRFVVKASRRITHNKRLRDAEDETGYLIRTVGVLRAHFGGLLFQLPPSMRKNLPRLRSFLAHVEGTRAAFEFRHPSWWDDEVFAALRAARCALCLADTDEGPPQDLIATADWGYVRLRRSNYTDAELREWADRLAALPPRETFVFFKHEDEATGPRLAARFLQLAPA